MVQRSASSIELNVGEVGSREQLHALVAETFQFPKYYGANWDAFDECIRDVAVPAHIRIIGLASLEAHLPREAALLVKCFNEFAAEVGTVRVTFHVS